MEDKNNASSLFSGFTPSSPSRSSRAILLVPHTVAAALTAVREDANSPVSALAESKPAPPPPPVIHSANSGDLSCIRTGTKHDLADATALASRILKDQTDLDNATAAFSKDLFVGVTLHIAYSDNRRRFQDMLDYIIDPCWDSTKQMLQYFNLSESFKQTDAAIWCHDFVLKNESLSEERAKSLVRRCHIQWQTALSTVKTRNKKTKALAGIQVFKPDAVAKAWAMLGDVKDEKKAGGERILENAQMNAGYRTIPDTRKAGLKLDDAKRRFENLVEPISRLQVDLVLAGAMNPEDFRITPILLLGDPGIGKTFLAMQLAESLGVNMEIVSAGGAQGGFQLTGSHISWNSARPGSLVSLLAEGKSAAPVVVVDEVDKIQTSQIPFLPVLLDLFEPNTSRRFKDEFLEMQFDASRIIFILTANSLDGVPTPLLSRVEVFNVPRPEPQQRRRIIRAEAKLLRLKTKRPIKMDRGTSEMLAERVDIDLRKTTRLVKEAFTKAMMSGDKVAKLVLPKTEGRRTIGFGC
ncbi:MAG: AAA family ATPase [Gammaproteobacteria bacterium]|nr:AAA family ATPase [Gammaproteobacteria bacterium]